MKVHIKGKNITITEGMENAVNKKLSTLDKYLMISDDVEARVLARTYPSGQKIEVTIPTVHVILRAEVVDSDFYNAVDKAVDKLEAQIRKHKEKLSRKNKPGLSEAFDFDVSIVDTDSGLDEELYDIVKTKNISPKPMDLEDAIVQMELLNHSFFVYRDMETDAVAVVYSRKNGGYGVIDTK